MRPATGGGPPRYQEIMAAISEDISSGRVAVGARLPTELELCARHGAGRHTVREAVRGLVEAGMVERRPRVGARVISAEPIGGYRWLPASAGDIAANVNATWIVRGRGTVVNGRRGHRPAPGLRCRRPLVPLRRAPHPARPPPPGGGVLQ